MSGFQNTALWKPYYVTMRLTSPAISLMLLPWPSISRSNTRQPATLQTNCIIERFHSTLANILKIFVSSTNKEWPDLLRSTLATYRMFTHNNDTEVPFIIWRGPAFPKNWTEELRLTEAGTRPNYSRTFLLQQIEFSSQFECDFYISGFVRVHWSLWC